MLKNEEAKENRKWHLVDASGKVVGRLATEIANLLRGKNSPQFTPNVDSGDFVVVINSDKVRFTGNKLTDKKYYWHTGFVGGIKSITADKQMKKDSTEVVRKAVKGMLQGNALGRKQLKKLRIFSGEEHTHDAQSPEKYEC